MTSYLSRYSSVVGGVVLLTVGYANSTQAQVALVGASGDSGGSFYQVNPTSGAASLIGSQTSGFYTGLDLQPVTGTLYGGVGSFLYTVDPTTGKPTTDPTTGMPSQPVRLTDPLTGANVDGAYSLSFSPSGLLYGLGNGNGNLYLINPTTGITTLVGTSGQSIFGLEFASNGKLYGCGTDLFTINPVNGAATDLGPLTPGGSALFNDMDFASNGVMYGVTSALSGFNTDSLYSIDLTSDKATLIGKTGGDIDAIASVPEPGITIWLGMALAWLGLRACRQAVRRARE